MRMKNIFVMESTFLAIAAINRELAAAREQMELIECRVSLDILNAKDERDKPLYGNETARSATLKLQLAGHREHAAIKRRAVELESKRAGLQAKHDRARRENHWQLLERRAEIISAEDFSSLAAR